MSIPFLDLKSIQLSHRTALTAALDRVLQSGWYVLGDEVSAFEQEFASHCDAAHAVGVANGLDALILCLKALGIGPGDEVLVPSNTYIATWLAVSHVGATPVPVEPRDATCNLDPDRLAAACTPRTRAVMPVHLYGQPAELGLVIAFARERGLSVVEDAAQAHGARYAGRRIGGHGDLVAWSFYPGKNLGALGDGGAVTTNDAGLAERIKVLRNYGSRVKYHNEVIGWNSRLDELQAAFLRAKLQHLDRDNEQRRRIADLYTAHLAGTPCLTLPVVIPQAETVWHLYVVRHPHRDRLAQALGDQGIGTMIHYPIPPHLQPAYAPLHLAAGSQPIAESMARQVLSLPIGPTMPLEQAQQVADAVRATCAALG